MQHKRALALAVAAIALFIGGLATALGGSATASVKLARHDRPRGHVVPRASAYQHVVGTTTYPVTSFSQQFGSNTDYFCPGLGNSPCDGNASAGDYGTIDRVPNGFSNGGYGNYAPDTPALAGKYFALVSGSATENQQNDCPEPDASEYSTLR